MSLLRKSEKLNISKYIGYYDRLALDDRKILIESEHGRQFTGMVFYLIKELLTNPAYRSFTVYLSTASDKKELFSEKARFYGFDRLHFAECGSDEYLRLLASAKYLINDTTFFPWFIKKEGQIYLNTWHGTPLKAMGRSQKTEALKIGNVQKNLIEADYILFPNVHTKDVMLRDYMVSNLSKGKALLGGYPRNEVFFDLERGSVIRDMYHLGQVHSYAYMPTFRGSVKDGKNTDSENAFRMHLAALDALLYDNEIFYLKLHPLDAQSVTFADYRHIKPFPTDCDAYDFLNACDVLITDYSSVFFDYACTGRKIILFPFDQDAYLRDRGMYFSLEEFPFPKVYDARALVEELRCGKCYDDSVFYKTYCSYENIDASQKLLAHVILGEKSVEEFPILGNGKENVIVYPGNLASNGITTAIRTLMQSVDLNKRNYYLSFPGSFGDSNPGLLDGFPEGVFYFPTMGDMDLTVPEKVIRKLFKSKRLKSPLYVRLLKKRIQQEIRRTCGGAAFDHAIQFNGYDNEILLKFTQFDCDRTFFVHSNMLEEIRAKDYNRLDVLRYAYQHSDHVAVVSEDIIPATEEISEHKADIRVVKNAINADAIREKSQMPIHLDSDSSATINEEELLHRLDRPGKKFINVGRFSVEKGHDRLVKAFERYLKNDPDAQLFIMGGYQRDGMYNKLKDFISEKKLENNVTLLLKISNPYPIIKACDYFVLSSFYEGFGLVLAEADILGLPVISTDIVGPRLFMQQNGGKLVENSEEGLYEGLCALAEGKVKPMNVDFEQYNAEAVAMFEQLFE